MAEAVVAAKLVEDRYIVLFPCHVIREQEPKNKEPGAKTTQKKHKHKQKEPTQTQKTTQPQSSDMTGTVQATSWDGQGEKGMC